jgi:stress response protein YsnF
MTRSAFPMLDMMLQMQRIGMRAMSVYQPVTSAFLDAAKASERVTASEIPGMARDRRSETRVSHETNAAQVVAIGEEVLNIGTRMVPGKTTRVRRVVVESPVQQDVTLHTETVIVERRRPQSSIGQDVLTEVTIEMTDSSEVPVVSKSVHMVEEVLLRKEVTARTETIRDTVKRDKLEIEEPSQLPVAFNPAQKQDDRKHASENQDRKQSVVPMQTDNKSGEPKRHPR